MNYLKGSRDEFSKLPEDSGFVERSNLVRSHLAEIFGSKNLSFLFGSGCSSHRNENEEVGIPTMGPLAQEFQTKLKETEGDESQSFEVTLEQNQIMIDSLGIDLTHENFHWNLERMMEVLLTAQQFCRDSNREDISEAANTLDDVIAGVKRYILEKCASGAFSVGDETVVSIYRRFYQSLSTRARGLLPAWVFTTNYDLFNERAMDRSSIPYSNGFTGTVERKFNPATYRLALAEQLDISSKRWAAVDGFVHFCKLHGSVNWTELDSGLYPIRESAEALNPSTDRVMIYPTPSKQTASFGSPYSDMFREFQRQIVQDQSVLIVAGFSFGDEHINNIIFQGLTLPSFRLIAFLDPDTNDITKELAELGDPRICFIWGDGPSPNSRAHYFETIVTDLLPMVGDRKADNAIEKVLGSLLKADQSNENAT